MEATIVSFYYLYYHFRYNRRSHIFVTPSTMLILKLRLDGNPKWMHSWHRNVKITSEKRNTA